MPVAVKPAGRWTGAVPVWPRLLRPHARTLPLAVRASAWWHPAAAAVILPPPGIRTVSGTGELRGPPLPRPSRPSRLVPQLRSLPLVVTAREKPQPAETDRRRVPSGRMARTGTLLKSVFVPLPSWPTSLTPQDSREVAAPPGPDAAPAGTARATADTAPRTVATIVTRRPGCWRARERWIIHSPESSPARTTPASGTVTSAN